MPLFDHHTHNLSAPAGFALINLPRAVVESPHTFSPRKGALYCAGIHPWWTDSDAETLWQGIVELARHPRVTAIGETGFDRLRGNPEVQQELFCRHAELAQRTGKQLIIHCVRAFDILLRFRRKFPPQDGSPWLVHGFRGKAKLAAQLQQVQIGISVGPRFNPDILGLIPPDALKLETDDSGLTIEQVAQIVRQTPLS